MSPFRPAMCVHRVDGAEPARGAGRRRVLGELVLAGFGRGHQDETAGRDLVGAFMAGGAIPPLVIVLGPW